MLRKNFLILAIMVLGIWMVIWAFFGWNPDSENKDIPQDTGTWFIEIINSTWNISDVQTWNVNIDEEIGYTKINVMMPKYFYNSGWKKFAQDLYNDSNIYMNFIFIDDLNSYRDKLYDTKFSDADLFLYPYDRNEKISIKTFSSEQSIQPFFDQLLYPITQTDKNSFIPFAADPMVTYVLSWLSAYNFYEISELAVDRESVMPLSFPLFFGINTEDFEWNWFKWEYQDILRYALLHYFKTNNDSVNLELRIDSNLTEKYNISDLRSILNVISATECKHFPSLCFQIYNFVWVRFGFLSDRDVVSAYFTWKKANFDNLSINPMPFAQLESPVRVWWRWIRGSLGDNNKIRAIYKLIEQYMVSHDKYDLRNSTLPVFKSAEEVWNWLLDNRYVWLRWYVLQAGWDYMNTLKDMTKFLELIWHEITAKEYLK